MHNNKPSFIKSYTFVVFSLLVISSFTLIPVYISKAEDGGRDTSNTSNEDKNDSNDSKISEDNKDSENDNKDNNTQDDQNEQNNEANDDRDGLRPTSLNSNEQNNENHQKNTCENRQNRIQNKISSFTESERFHRQKFNEVYNRLVALVSRLDTQGVNTAKLTTDLATLKNKIDVLETKYQALMTTLNDLKNTACTDTAKGSQSLSEIRSLLTDLRSTVLDIRSFFVETIRPDLTDLKQTLNSQKSDDNKSGTTEPGENSQ